MRRRVALGATLATGDSTRCDNTDSFSYGNADLMEAGLFPLTSVAAKHQAHATTSSA